MSDLAAAINSLANEGLTAYEVSQGAPVGISTTTIGGVPVTTTNVGGIFSGTLAPIIIIVGIIALVVVLYIFVKR